MKKSLHVAFVAMSLTLSGCFSTDDDGLGRSLNLQIQDAFTVDNQKEYVIGDTIFFELQFSRYLPEDGYTSLLDIFETTGDEQFGYSFGLSQFSGFSERFETVFVDEQFIIGPRAESSNYYYGGSNLAATLNSEQDTYESRVGVILAESGRFRFDFDPIFLGNGYEDDKIHVDIQHTFSEVDSLALEFNVSEE